MTALTICLLTYNRLEYAKRTLESTLRNIRFSGELSVHIASDGDTTEYINSLAQLAADFEIVKKVSVTNSERKGYGANFNLATQVIHSFSDYIIPLEDDWELTRELKIDELVADIEGCYTDISVQRFDCIRLGYLSFTQPLYGQVVDRNNRKYLILDPLSPEPHVWAGHPRLETVQRQRECGEWPEGEPPGRTEFMMAHVRRVRRGVAWPMELVKPYGDLFAHIGTERSY